MAFAHLRENYAKRIVAIIFEMPREWIEIHLNSMKCEATGVDLFLEMRDDVYHSPFRPSIDRIDNNKGYTKDNCRIVCVIYNKAKSDYTSEEVLLMAKGLVFMKKFNKLYFAYGSLKSGHGNNRLLTRGGSEFVGKAVTKPFYRLWNLGPFPGMTEDRENGKAIEGELWRVTNEETARDLDRLEGHPHHYRREIIEIEGVEEEVSGYIYNYPVDNCKECSPVWG